MQDVENKSSRQIIRVSYSAGDGVLHERTIELSDDGTSCKGKDIFEVIRSSSASSIRDDKAHPATLTARFHLHPDIRCQPQKEGGYLLKSVSGAQWLFSCSLPKHVTIEESVYLGYYGKPQKTLQLAITIAPELRVDGLRWEMKKLAS